MNRLIRRAILSLAYVGVAFWLLQVYAQQGSEVFVDDFIEYWAVGRLFFEGQNPYDHAALFELQRGLGWPGANPLMMWNPPHAIALVLPISLLPFLAARVLWLALGLLLVVLSSALLWRIYDGDPEKRTLALVVAVAFPPTFLALGNGQISPFTLFGLILFLGSVQSGRWWLAGAGLPLVAIKPHLLHLFWPMLLFWLVRERRWQVIAGGALVALAMAGPLLALNPEIVAQYREATATSPAAPPFWVVPTLGFWLRALIDIDSFWLQFVPQLFAQIVYLVYWYPRRDEWEWKRDLPLLLLLSVATSPYGWSHDGIVLLPWLIAMLARQERPIPSRPYLVWSGLLYATLIIGTHDAFNMWFVPGLLAIELVGRRRAAASRSDAGPLRTKVSGAPPKRPAA